MKYVLLLAVSVAFASCQLEEEYRPGEANPDLCQYFYFPTQENATDHMLDPEDKRVVEFKAARKLEYGAVSVPVEVSGDAEIFDVEEIFFDDGQTETTFKVRFENAEQGQKYTCTIAVTDPDFISQYGLENTDITFSVMIVKWDYLGVGKWRDDLYSDFFNVTIPYHETECEVYERADLKGYYRIDGVYTAEFLAEMATGSAANASGWVDYCFESSIFLDATEPSKAYFPFGYLGFVAGDYGYAIIGSDVDEVLGAGASNGYYGTMDRGVLTFPSNGLIFGLSNSGYYYANQAGKFRFVLPGYEAFDYSVSLYAGESENGEIPVIFDLGADVKQVKYAAFEGRVTDVEMVARIEDIKSGAVQTQTLSVSDTLSMEFAKTSFYTVVACSYDAAGEYQSYGSVTFGYDTPENPMDLQIDLGLIVSDKYAGSGRTSENSMEFYVYGEDIKEAKVGLYKKAYYDNYPVAIQQEVYYYLDPLDKYQLDSLNTSMYSGIVGGLSADTDYALVVYADNGYHKGFFTASATTEGEFVILDEDYIYYDLPYNPDRPSADYFGDWELYSWDIFNSSRVEREYRGTVTIEDNLNDEELTKQYFQTSDGSSSLDYVADIVNVKGMYPELSAEYGIDDTQHFEYYNGFIYSLQTSMPSGRMTQDGKTTKIYPTNVYYYIYDGSLYAGLEVFAMIGGFVQEDLMVMVCNLMDNVAANYIAAGLCYFTDAAYSGNGNILKEGHGYPLFIKSGSPLLDQVESKAMAQADASVAASCRKVSYELSKGRTNHVETDSGYVKSVIDRVMARPHNYLENNTEETDLSLDCPAVSFNVR